MTFSRRVDLVVILALLSAGGFSWMQRNREEPVPSEITGLEKATLAGGCYWCMEPAFDHLDGVVHVRAGHAGGGTHRREAVEILFDPQEISYRDILKVFWANIDPVDDQGQFCDIGSDYRSGVFVHDSSQREVAEASKADVERELGLTIVTEILEADSFVPAGEYDQNYYRKHPVRYMFYRMNCGRDARLHEVWKK